MLIQKYAEALKTNSPMEGFETCMTLRANFIFSSTSGGAFINLGSELPLTDHKFISSSPCSNSTKVPCVYSCIVVGDCEGETARHSNKTRSFIDS